ncbi:MAG: hypothetical protein Unbinned6354contig1000_27 [Prokaryotic dsDNA virus sp.]|nr:hypothetical protein [Cytophagaceae bacterium]QDP54324.1 MAG: hypothetical protein Unbinned6354contig1000_27 [Prokaryotic dsDNA virus sp.]|tara:strand:+ start:2774 stop:3256 length:483 start_codon:yes stop_codon:yes gene_type:complete
MAASYKYQTHFPDMAYRLTLAGYSTTDLAKAFDVSIQSICYWLKTYPEFKAAVHAARHESNAEVVAALYKSCVGFSRKVTKEISTVDGVQQVEEEKFFAPHIGAIKYFLNNRCPDKWSERQELELSGGGVSFNLDFTGKGQPKNNGEDTPEDAENMDFLD